MYLSSGYKIPPLNEGHVPRFWHESRDDSARVQEAALADASVRRSLGTAGRTCLMTSGPSVDRAPPRSRPSRPAKLLSHSVRHRVEGQVSASCSCAQHTRRTPARSTALSRPVIGASQMSDEAAVQDDLAMVDRNRNWVESVTKWFKSSHARTRRDREPRAARCTST